MSALLTKVAEEEVALPLVLFPGVLGRSCACCAATPLCLIKPKVGDEHKAHDSNQRNPEEYLCTDA
jgi:hypothetical protein